MPKQSLRDQRYVNRTGRTGINSRYDNSLRSKTTPGVNNITYINGVPIEREKLPEYDWTNDIFGRMIISLYVTYLKLTGKLPILTKADRLAKENKLEKGTQNA